MLETRISISDVRYGAHGVDRIIATVDLHGTFSNGSTCGEIQALFASRDRQAWAPDVRRKYHVRITRGVNSGIEMAILEFLRTMLPLTSECPEHDYQMHIIDRVMDGSTRLIQDVAIKIFQEDIIDIGLQWKGRFSSDGKSGDLKLEMKDPKQFKYPIRGLDIDVTSFIENDQLPSFDIWYAVVENLAKELQQRGAA